MVVPKFIVEAPPIGGLTVGRPKVKIYPSFTCLTCSPSSFRIALQALSEGVSFEERRALRRAQEELSTILVLKDGVKLKLFKAVWIERVGKKNALFLTPSELLEGERVRIDAPPRLRKESEMLAWLLRQRWQKIHTAEFLSHYLLGIPLDRIGELKGEAKEIKARQRVERIKYTVKNFLSFYKKSGIEFQVEFFKAKIGNYSVDFIKRLEFRG